MTEPRPTYSTDGDDIKFDEIVLHEGIEYPRPEFEAWIAKNYGESTGCEYLDVTTWGDLDKGRYVFIAHKIISGRGEHERFSKLHTSEA